MTFPVGPRPSGTAQWRVWSLRRVGKQFRWSLLPDRPVNTNNPLAVVIGLLVLLEFVFIMPTVGLVRFAVYHARSPGWCLESRYVTGDGNPQGAPVELQTGSKRQARQLRRILQHEFGRGADFNSPSVQAAIAQNQASFRPVASPPISGEAF
jgi:hypothetical protein